MKHSYRLIVSTIAALLVTALPAGLNAQTSENMTLLGNWGMGGGEIRAVTNQGDLVYYGLGNVLAITSFEDPANPFNASSVILDDMVEDIVWTVIGGQTYCVVSGTSLNIVNVTNPMAATLTSTMALSGYGEGLGISGTNVYVAVGSSGMEVIDISNPASPTSLATVAGAGSGYAEGINVSSPYAYLGNGANATIFDISTPSAPVILGAYEKEGWIQDVMPISNYMYVCDWSGGVDVVSIANPAEPTLTTNFANPVNADIMFDGNYGYVASRDGGLTVMDVSNPAAPTLVGTYTTTGSLRKVSYGAITIGGTPTGHIFTAEVSGLGAVNVSAPGTSMSYSGRVNVLAPASGICYSVVVRDNLAYLSYGDVGVRIIDVTSPTNMFEVGSRATPGGTTRNMVLKGDYAYVADRGGGVLVLDISDPANIDSVTSFIQGTTNTVALSGNYVYAAMRDYGIGIIDATNPGSPTLANHVGTYYGEGVGSDGNALVLSTWEKLYFFDITTPTAPALRDSFALATGTTELLVKGSYCYVGDFDSLRIFDISDLANVVQLSSVFTNGSWDANAFVEGNTCYVNAETNGIVAFDITDPSAPNQVASYNGTETSRNVYVVNGLIYDAEKEGGLSIYRNDLYTSIASEGMIPSDFALVNYPNPFNPSTTISYSIPESAGKSSVRLEVFNVLGQNVQTLVNNTQEVGNYSVVWNSMDQMGHVVPAGIYFYRLSVGEMVRTNKMILLK